jgi:hypothetical protein
MGPLHMALNIARQNAVLALSAYSQRVLNHMLKVLAPNAALCHNYRIIAIIIKFHNIVYKQ